MKAPVQVRGLTQNNPGRWQHFAHSADIGIRGIGATKEAAFEQAGMKIENVLPTHVVHGQQDLRLTFRQTLLKRLRAEDRKQRTENAAILERSY
ncbi:MAG TPA: hypothetical protein VMB85_13330 [Bryobacteraceae bacterium]|nr:hypothetical protein [Bryobacteraceae bacterium]